MRSYKDWVHWLENRSIMPLVKPGLENTHKALWRAEILPLVDKNKVIHIAGTNGKGTTAKTLEQLLVSQNKSVGLYTSPHLTDTCERLRINNKNISKEEFVSLCERYEPLIEEFNLSHFESLTLFACHAFFKDNRVDYAIFEIGLGGTWDATNAIPHNTSVITTLGFDHMHILGNTIEEIADNKFGIIQHGNNVLHFPYSPALEKRLAEKVKKEEAHVIALPPYSFRVDTAGVLPKYILQSPWGEVGVSLMGERAIQNMWLALNVFNALGFDPQGALDVLSKIQWPARMTELKTNLSAPVYLSGDHNIQGLESLLEIVKQSRYENIYFILGLSKNRTHEEFLAHLKKVPRAKIILTRPEFNGIDPDNKVYPFYENAYSALATLKDTTSNDLVIVTGSLYLCGDLLKVPGPVL